MSAPNQRTILVLCVLIGAMTLASVLLLILEPGPIAPASRLSLSVTASPAEFSQRLLQLNPSVEPRQWTGITIRFSGARYGSYSGINDQHYRIGLGGAAHHFVIGNGRGSDDGKTEWGFRWQNQDHTPYAADERGRVQQPIIDICLIGTGLERPSNAQITELVRLVQALQARFQIQPGQVRMVLDANGEIPTGFPLATFRQQLLSQIR